MSKKNYTAILEANETKYEGKGETPIEALLDIDLDYTQVKTKGTFTLKYGKKHSERYYYLMPLRRIFANKHKMAGVARDLEYLLDE